MRRSSGDDKDTRGHGRKGENLVEVTCHEHGGRHEERTGAKVLSAEIPATTGSICGRVGQRVRKGSAGHEDRQSE